MDQAALTKFDEIITGIEGMLDISSDLGGAEISGPIVVKGAAKMYIEAPVLIPDEPDADGDTVSAAKIEELSHRYMESFRFMDVKHTMKSVAYPVASYILKKAQEFTLGDGSILKLPMGTWMLGAKVRCQDTWAKIMSGEYQGLSVMGVSKANADALLMGAGAAVKSGGPTNMMFEDGMLRRIKFTDLGEDWVGVAISILPRPAVAKSRFVVIKGEDNLKEKSDLNLRERIIRLVDRFIIKGDENEDNNDTTKEDIDMTHDEMVKLIRETVGGMFKDAGIDLKKAADPPKDPDKKADGADAKSPTKEPDKAKTPDPPPPAKADIDKADTGGDDAPVEASMKGVMEAINANTDTVKDLVKALLGEDKTDTDDGDDKKVPVSSKGLPEPAPDGDSDKDSEGMFSRDMYGCAEPQDID
ncbi:MAG: hypothetical protein GY841_20080 [FCB group bacterium]|nr:hypothetical protein [FCB group bacterium]